MALDRSEGRDVHIYDSKDPSQAVLGGLHLTNGITNILFYSMIEIILLFQSPFSLQDENGVIVERNEHPLQPGKYYVNGSYSVTKEPVLTRTISLHSGSRHEAFRGAVRARDGRCVVTGQEVVLATNHPWVGLQAAYIFPLAYLGYWNDHDFDRWITDPSPAGGPINSVQNGLLLRADIHQLFDNYVFSINPDDNYKVVCFEHTGYKIAGSYLDQRFLDQDNRPADQLLRWHFRQAVLTNMKGAGEPIFEHDFPSGSDMAGEIRSGAKAAERMEFELFSRLAAY